MCGLVTRTHGRLRVRVSLCDLSHLPGARPMLAGVLEGATSAPRAPRAGGTRAGATHARGQSLEGPPGHRASPHPTALSGAPLAAMCRRHLSAAAVVAEPLEDSHACCSGRVLHSVPLGGRRVRAQGARLVRLRHPVTGGVRARAAAVYARTHRPWLAGTKGRHLSPAGWRVLAELPGPLPHPHVWHEAYHV